MRCCVYFLSRWARQSLETCWAGRCCAATALTETQGLVSKCNATILNCCWGPTVRNNFWIFTWCNSVPRWSSLFKNTPRLIMTFHYLLQAETQHEQKMKGGYLSNTSPAKIQKLQPFSWLGDFCVWWILQRPTMLATVWQNCGCECLKCRWGGGRGMTKTAECSSERINSSRADEEV